MCLWDQGKSVGELEKCVAAQESQREQEQAHSTKDAEPNEGCPNERGNGMYGESLLELVLVVGACAYRAVFW